MGFRLAPTGPVMTANEFLSAAMDRPLSPWATFGGSVADAALQTPGFGTVVREGKLPSLAKTFDYENSGLSSGRGGAATKFKTAPEVQAEGDKLYENIDEYKASPSFRENIPFEKGMTESRAKALAEQNDISKVRQFYSSKRPATAFLGSVVGSAVDPINYIPILGEVAGAAAVARVGRVAGRALTGSADAALNSAIFQTALSGEKAQLGDDVSWAAIGMNAAFAALAGAAIGGAVGGFSKFRHWSVDRTAPEIEVPKVGDDVIARVETAANRVKSAEVMNDAIHGIVNDGEVRLGERSQSHVTEMIAKVDDTANQNLQQWAQGSKILDEAGNPRVVYHGSDQPIERFKAGGEVLEGSRNLTAGEGIYFTDNPKLAAAYAGRRGGEGANISPVYLNIKNPLVVKSPTFWAKLRAKVKGDDAVRDARYKSVYLSKAEVEQYKAQGYDGVVNEASSEIVVFSPDQIRSKFESGPRAVDYSPAKPDAVPDSLAPAAAKIEANVKVKSDPESAQIKRTIDDAKEEGFDPETNANDLELDMDSYREQGQVTAEDESAFAAADETFAAVKAWEDVMNVARTCAIR